MSASDKDYLEGGRREAALASDLAYVRSLAEEGRDAPLVGGVFYFIWGGLMSAASLFAFLILTGVAPIGGVPVLAPWAVAGLIGWAASMFMGMRLGAKPGAFTMGNRTARAVWLAVGLFMTVFWLGLMIVHDDFTEFGVPSHFLFYLMFPVAFGVYGVAFYATATAARLNWLKGFALLSWGFAVAALFLMTSNYQFLLGAAGCFFCAALPGLILMRQEPKDII
ncbi:hypothetical protein [Hyphococcus sp.]|uniref:hypothetical protein n=1 Tax=Hyphococcus sp. TaxID=2038636 RepID=UPI0035C732C7